MSKIGYGYGSEWHLLRYLGYHRAQLNNAVTAALATSTLPVDTSSSIHWLDLPFSGVRKPLQDDREYSGVGFLPAPQYDYVRAAWGSFWAQRGTMPTYDAVGFIQTASGALEWLLVEAKAHEDECSVNPPSHSAGSRKTIEAALDKARDEVGALPSVLSQWLGCYYQYANRLAVLHFLNNLCSPNVPTRLLNVYFYGECPTAMKGRKCPQTEAGWQPILSKIHKTLGLNTSSPLMKRVHSIYLPINR